MKLSPEIIKMREALLERIGDKPLKEVAQIVNEILLNETDSTNRLAALAARVKVLKNYINVNYNVKKDNKKITNIVREQDNETSQETINKISKKVNAEQDDNWVRVEMLKPGVVNGVRFPQGVIIDVSKTDADKLVKDNLSKIIDINNQKNQEDNNSDTVAKEDAALKATTKEDVPSETAAKEDAALKATTKEDVPSETAAKEDAPSETVAKEDAPSETVAKEDALLEETKIEDQSEKQSITNKKAKVLNKKDDSSEENTIEKATADKKIIKTKSTKITEETIELTDPKAVAEALGLNDKKKKDEEPTEIEEEIDIEAFETGKKK